jgi:hypothetical protein
MEVPMNVLRLCSPVIAAAVIGVVLSAPAVFARPKDATVAENDRCAHAADLSIATQPGDPCLARPDAAGRDARPQ